ncbi:hypothetical protein [Erwinia phyllosphaerae]|uniref:hypothetical protein n=1 Tax=Erwinia phyllosphaerae TaxID=2853256 RepID=UPI001FEFDA21|nr:hypothetical protein [Erwinia phyllosphaerae]MBV4366292.1 hypothetical protein [Erwinia phyllosphaerae]
MKDELHNIVIAVPIDDVGLIIKIMKEHNVEAALSEKYKKGYAFDSALYDIVIEVIKSPYFIPPIALALRAFLKRNDKKKFIVKTPEGESLNLEGYSKKEIEQILKRVKRLSFIERQ